MTAFESPRALSTAELGAFDARFAPPAAVTPPPANQDGERPPG